MTDTLTVEIQPYPNGKVAVFRYGRHSAYVPIAEAQPLLNRGSYSWRDVCKLPSQQRALAEQLRRRDAMHQFAGPYAAAAAFPILPE